VDDILDYTGDESLGKPHGNDLMEGIITAPVLFALEESAEMQGIFSRGFSEPNDIEKVSTQSKISLMFVLMSQF